MNSKRGFTLVELLAVIVVLGIIFVIAVPNIMKVIENSKVQAYKNNEKMLEKLASTYLYYNDVVYPTKGTSITITLDDLKKANLITNLFDVKNPSHECDAYVEVNKSIISYHYRAYINCGSNYTTTGFNGLELPIFTVAGNGIHDYFNKITKATNGYVAIGYSNSNNKDLENLNVRTTDAVIVNYSDNGDIVWKKAFGGTKLEYFEGIVQASDGYIVVGRSESTDGDLSGINKGGYDAIIVKYDNSGNIVWNKNYGGTGTDHYYGVIVVNDGYIAVGYSNSTNGDLSGINKGGYDGIIVKYDFNGNVIWKKNYGGTGTDYFYNLSNISDGFIVVGSSASTNDDLSGLSKGGTDAVIIKYDFNGNVIWKKNYGGTGTEYFTSVDHVSNGYVAVGYSNSINVDLEYLNKGDYDSIIVKYDTLGNVIWKKNYGGSKVDHFKSVSATSDDNIIAVGRTISIDEDITDLFKGGTSYYDATIVKYNSNGDIIWNDNYGGTGHDYFEGIIVNGNSYTAVGNSASTNGDLSGINKGGTDAIIVKYDQNGNKMWNKNFGGGPGADYFESITYFDNSYITVGRSDSQVGLFEGKNKGGVDGIIFKYDLSGKLLWNNNFGGTGTDNFYGISSTLDNLIAVGSSSSTNGDLSGLNKGGTDAIIVKYDGNGNILWNKNYGGSSTDCFSGVIEVNDGYIAVGYSASTNGDLLGLNKGGTDAIIVAFDKNGNVVWEKNFGGTGTDQFKNVYLTAMGYVAVGHSNSINGDLDGMNNGGYDGIIVKYDFDGNILFKQNYGGSGNDYFNDVIKGSTDNYIVGYSASIDGDLTGLNIGGTDAIIVKYDQNGNVIWKKNYGGTSTDYFYAVEIWNNEIIVVGQSTSTNGDLTGLRIGGYDGIIAKYDIDGNVLMRKNFGGSADDSFSDVTIIRDGLIMCGYTSSITHDFLDMGSGYIDAMTVGYKE